MCAALGCGLGCIPTLCCTAPMQLQYAACAIQVLRLYIRPRAHDHIWSLCVWQNGNVYILCRNCPGSMEGLWNDAGSKFQLTGPDAVELQGHCV